MSCPLCLLAMRWMKWRGYKKGGLSHHFDKAEKQLQPIKNNDHTADYIDDPQYPVVEFMAEQGNESCQAQKPEAGG